MPCNDQAMGRATNHAAVGDCEHPRGGLIGQPANAVSSLAYCAAGAWVVGRARRAGLAGADHGQVARVGQIGWAAIAAGLGSVAYHGPGSRLGRAAHDGSLGALLASLTVAQWRLHGPPAQAVLWGTVAAGTYPPTAPIALGLNGAAGIAAEVAHIRPPTDTARRERWAAAAVLLAAGPIHLMSRTDRRLCDPHSRWQGHALWHALTALAVALRADSLLAEPEPEPEPVPVPEPEAGRGRLHEAIGR